jgi:hypothetical protein
MMAIRARKGFVKFWRECLNSCAMVTAFWPSFWSKNAEVRVSLPEMKSYLPYMPSCFSAQTILPEA